jgi:hypothetical protein
VVAQADQAVQTLTDTQSAVEKQEKELKTLQRETKIAKAIGLTVGDIEAMGKKATFSNNITLTPNECETLKRYATNGVLFHIENKRLKEKLESAQKSASIWKQRYGKLHGQYTELKKKAQPYLDALEIASERVRSFLSAVLAGGQETKVHSREQETKRRENAYDR